jgi:hypothetical protein
LSTATTALIVAGISAAVSLGSAIGLEISRRRFGVQLAARQAAYTRDLEEYKDDLSRTRDAEAKTSQSQRLVARYRDPLLLSAFDLQSRIFNAQRPGGFHGGRDPEYFVLNTTFLIAQFFGWLEILRHDLQFLDLGAAEATRELSVRLDRVQQAFASTFGQRDDYYIYRGEQRAIGEVMITRLIGNPEGPSHECLGYARFVAKQSDPEFARWFERLKTAIADIPARHPHRLTVVQNALIDVIDHLDPDRERFAEHRDLLPGAP